MKTVTPSLLMAILAMYLAIASSDTRVDFVLSARDLPNMDIFNGAPDPYVMVYYASTSNESYSKVAQNSYISDQNNPDWPDVFSFNLTGAFSQQKIQIDIYDSDIDADDYIGSAEFRLRDIVDSFGQTLNKDLMPAGNGRLIVYGLVNGTVAKNVRIDSRLTNTFNTIPSSNSHHINKLSPKFFKP